MNLIIGGSGLIGSALVSEFLRIGTPFVATARRSHNGFIEFDLLHSDPSALPHADTVFLIAAMPGFAICESNPLTWRVNVDAQIKLARGFRKSLVVYISSNAVEIAGATAYARQKAAVEAFINVIDGAIVRLGPVTKVTAPDIAKLLVNIARDQARGLHRWP